MTFQLSFLIKADSANAKAGLEATGKAARQAADEIGNLGATGSSSAAELDSLSVAEKAAAAEVQRLGRAQELAASQVGTLTKGLTLNRIGMLELQAAGINSFQALAAGMNPLQVAMMEGSQVIGAFVQGTEGGLAALKTAVIGLAANPLTLLVAGVTAAAGAALYFSDAFGQADTTLQDFHDGMASLNEVQTAYTKAVRDAQTPLAQLREKFGENADAAQRLYKITEMFEKLQFAAAFAKQVTSMDASLRGLQNRVRAIGNIQAMIDSGKLGNATMPGSMGTTGADAARQRIAQMAADLQSQLGVSVAQAKLLAEAVRQVDVATTTLGKSAAMDHFAMTINDIVANTKNASPALIQLGEDAAKVARHGYMISDAMSSAAGNAGKLGQVDISSGLDAAATYAKQMNVSLADALSHIDRIAAIGGGRGRGGNAQWQDWRHRSGAGSVTNFGDLPPTPTMSSLHGNHASHVRQLTDAERAYKQVIREATGNLRDYQLKLEAVQLAEQKGAISAAQATQEEARLKEKILENTDAGKFYAESMRSFESAMANAIVTGRGLGTVLADLATKLAEAAAQAALFGTGPLSGGGTLAQPNGGLLGGLFSGLTGFPGGGRAPVTDAMSTLNTLKLAKGGLITGPGSGTSDSILMYGSSGEFMMNAKATARYRPVLEAMNSGLPGIIPGFAGGGPIGAGSQAAMAYSGARPQKIDWHVHVHGTGDAQLMEAMRAGVYTMLTRWSRDELPGRVQSIQGDMRRRG